MSREVQGAGSSMKIADSLAEVAVGPTSDQTDSRGTAPQSVRAVVFELEQVLHDACGWRRWLVQLLNRMGRPCNLETFTKDWEQHHAAEVGAGKVRFFSALDAMLCKKGLSAGQIDEVRAAGRLRQRQLDESARPWPGVCETLRRLTEQGKQLAVISEACDEPNAVERRLISLGLNESFQTVVAAADLGHAYPSACLYDRALEALGTLPAETIYVGASRRGLRGAMSASMPCVAFNAEFGAPSHCRITRLDELHAIVGDAATPSPFTAERRLAQCA